MSKRIGGSTSAKAARLHIAPTLATMADIVSVLYGDSACVTFGWTPLGLADHSGYRWAIEQATRVIARAGPRDALRTLRRLPASGAHGAP